MKSYRESGRKIKIGGLAKILAGLIAGFSFFTISSHQKSPVYKKLPEKKLKNVSYIPNIKIQKDSGHYHIHHWMIFSALYAPFVLVKRLRSKFLHGLIIGSIAQGLTYKDRFRMKHPSKAQVR